MAYSRDSGKKKMGDDVCAGFADLHEGCDVAVKAMVCRKWDAHNSFGKYLSTEFILSDPHGQLIQCSARSNIITSTYRDLQQSRMCIAVFIWQSHPLYPFILLPNRDEFHIRPTKPAKWWEGEDIYGGRDEVALGTWLACSRSWRFALVTNFRETEMLHDAMSRGDLPVCFLKSKKCLLEFAMEVMENANSYNGFNLILADFYSKEMVYVTNRPKGRGNHIMQVSPGIHVITNASLDCSWPKARRLSLNFKELLATYTDTDQIDTKELVDKLMTDTVKPEESELPGVLHKDIEYQTSSIFVDTDTSKGRY